MAIWCEQKGYPGAAKFLFSHADEERMHMLKLVHYMNDRGGEAQLNYIDKPDNDYKNLLDVFEKSYGA